MRSYTQVLAALCLSCFIVGSSAEQCGHQAGGALCPGGQCCSTWGWCGTTEKFCGGDCQSQCGRGGGGGSERNLSDIVPRPLFESMLLHRDDRLCPAKGFYTYDSFISAAEAFPDFGNTGDMDIRKREIAAFFGQTSEETSGGWPTAPGGPYTWGYCFNRDPYQSGVYCRPSYKFPCSPGKKYYARGPIRLTGNDEYGQCGKDIGVDLLNDPDLVLKDPVVAFKTAIWDWITPLSDIPSCHDVITGIWQPSLWDTFFGRLPGYGMTTNILAGDAECGKYNDHRDEDRIGFYKRYCDMFGIDHGDNLDCSHQKPFNSGSGLPVNSTNLRAEVSSA